MSRWLRLRSAARSASAPNLCSSTDLPYIYRQNQAQGDRGGEPDDNEEPAAGKAVKPASDHQGGRQCRDDADADELTQGLRRCGLGAHPWRLQHLYGALETSLSSRTAPFRPSSRRRSSDSSHTGTISAAPSAETPSISSTARRKRALPSSRIARSEEHTSELQSRVDLVCRLLLEKKKQMPWHLNTPKTKKNTIIL